MNDNNNNASPKKSPLGDLEVLLRKNIANLKPYSSARDEFSGSASVFLDANENPWDTGYNRYPDPYQQEVKKRIAEIKSVRSNQIFLGNGSDEPIDLLYRAFCNPGIDNAIIIEPSYGMYTVAADINDIEIRKVLLNDDYQIEAQKLMAAVDDRSKLLFLCSPNNPTGNSLNRAEMLKVLENFPGIVVVDEAYVDFAPGTSLLPLLESYPNLVILQTFSKAWGLAGVRMGMAFAHPDIIAVLSKIKYPYNVNALTQQRVMQAMQNIEEKKVWVKTIIAEREKLANELKKLPYVQKVYPS
ncbi:MAG TPA: histidinol-phosphate transaminase, partial [Prolixibacteraceae bacterium]|nr:histidinol-phosphate transaminase [Prolixibacteraceae bacterium]